MKIYHNPRCRKSRETLALLRENGLEPEIVEYLKEPLQEAELALLLKKLGIPAEKLLRKGERVFKENFKGKDFSEAEWIAIIAEHPVLMERPIVETEDRAVIGRPPENINALL